MFNYKKFLLCIIVWGCVSHTQQTINEYAHNHFVSQFFVQSPQAAPAPVIVADLSWLEKMKHQLIQALPRPNILNTNAHELASIAFNKINDTQCQPIVIDTFSLNKLNVLSCDQNNTISLLNNTIGKYLHTWSAKGLSALELANPTTYTALLAQRQDTIKAIIASNNSSKLQSIFEQMSHHEKGLWTFWHATPLIDKNFESVIYFSLPGFKKLNNSVIALETEKYINYGLTATINLISLLSPLVINKYAYGIPWSEIFPFYMKSLQGLSNPAVPTSTKILTLYSSLFAPLLGATTLYQTSIVLKDRENATTAIQQALTDVATQIHSFKQLKVLIQQSPELVEIVPQLQSIIDIFNTQKHTAQFNKLLKLLDTNTFTGQASLLSISGRVKVAYKLMQAVKDEFIPALQAAAQLEVYCAAAQLYQDNCGTDTPYCFVDFTLDGPRIEATQFWNPLVERHLVIPNDIRLQKNGGQHVVLTGPNTAGKTTLIKALAHATLLAQTFGIAPAQSLTLSPFSKINCFMEINDDIASGTSLFKAEVKRAKYLIEQLQSLPQNEYVFTLMDEVFTSTSPKEGEAAAYRFTHQFGNFNNALTILATHYPQLTELPLANPSFTNMHVEVIRNNDNSLTRTFKLKDGASFMNIAMDILKDEGVL